MSKNIVNSIVYCNSHTNSSNSYCHHIKGIEKTPIILSTEPIDKRLGKRAIIEIFRDLNKTKNIENKTKTTNPRVKICELNKL